MVMSVPMQRATVVVRSHHGDARLARTVAIAGHEAAAAGADVLVLAAAGDAARAVAETVAPAREHVRIVCEPEGSPGRERALREIATPLMAFLDDDVVPRPGWLAALLAPFVESGVWAVGGPVRLAFEVPPPAWLVPELHPALGAWEPGAQDVALRYGRQPYPHDANLAVRTDAVRLVGGLPAEPPRPARRYASHEAAALCHRLERAGGGVRYAAAAAVDRHIDADRTSTDWFLARYWHGGQAAAHFMFEERGLVAALWRLQWSYGRHLLQLPYHPRPPIDGARLAAECRRREALGYLVELAHLLPGLPRWGSGDAAAPAPVHH